MPQLPSRVSCPPAPRIQTLKNPLQSFRLQDKKSKSCWAWGGEELDSTQGAPGRALPFLTPLPRPGAVAWDTRMG